MVRFIRGVVVDLGSGEITKVESVYGGQTNGLYVTVSKRDELGSN